MNKEKVTHLDSGEYFLMPISGRHTKTECGMYFQDSHPPSLKRHTVNIKKVTCSRCLKKMEKVKK